MLCFRPAETLESDVFEDGDISGDEEDEEFYPKDCQWEQEEEPAEPETTPVITEKVTALL